MVNKNGGSPFLLRFNQTVKHAKQLRLQCGWLASEQESLLPTRLPPSWPFYNGRPGRSQSGVEVEPQSTNQHDATKRPNLHVWLVGEKTHETNNKSPDKNHKGQTTLTTMGVIRNMRTDTLSRFIATGVTLKPCHGTPRALTRHCRYPITAVIGFDWRTQMRVNAAIWYDLRRRTPIKRRREL